MSVSYFIPDLAPEDLHRCEEIVRRSRFSVSLAHTPTPEAAKSFIERIKQEFHLAYEPLLILAVGKGIEKIELVPIGPSDSHTYYRENGTHYVPKLRAEELTIKE